MKAVTVRTNRPFYVSKVVIQSIDKRGWKRYDIMKLTQASRNRLARIVWQAQRGVWDLYRSDNYYVISKIMK